MGEKMEKFWKVYDLIGGLTKVIYQIFREFAIIFVLMGIGGLLIMSSNPDYVGLGLEIKKFGGLIVIFFFLSNFVFVFNEQKRRGLS